MEFNRWHIMETIWINIIKSQILFGIINHSMLSTTTQETRQNVVFIGNHHECLLSVPDYDC